MPKFIYLSLFVLIKNYALTPSRLFEKKTNSNM